MYRPIVLAFACAMPGALFAQAAAPATSTAPQASNAQPDKKICRREESTGSLLSKRVCHTKQEWTEIDAVNGRTAEQFNAQRRVSSSGQ